MNRRREQTLIGLQYVKYIISKNKIAVIDIIQCTHTEIYNMKYRISFSGRLFKMLCVTHCAHCVVFCVYNKTQLAYSSPSCILRQMMCCACDNKRRTVFINKNSETIQLV